MSLIALAALLIGGCSEEPQHLAASGKPGFATDAWGFARAHAAPGRGAAHLSLSGHPGAQLQKLKSTAWYERAELRQSAPAP